MKMETKRVISPGAEEILGKKFEVLDKGFVRLVDCLGNDGAIVQAARVSYGKGTDTKRKDRTLIRYLMRNRHTSPFEMVEMKFHLRVPMDAWRQWIRHRTANVNEYSTRYSIAIDDKQETEPDKWRFQSEDNKQGSEGFLDIETGKYLSQREEELHNLAKQVYNERIEKGVAREQARKDLPLSNYTEAYWKIDLHNLFHFLKLRMDKKAQYEIKQYANVIGNEIVKRVVPISYEAFEDYVLNAFTLSRSEQIAIYKILNGADYEDISNELFENRYERQEFLEKFSKISLSSQS